jgi:hypothetical protein
MHRVTHLGLLVFEAVGQRDASPVFLAGYRVFDWLNMGVFAYPRKKVQLVIKLPELSRIDSDQIGAQQITTFPAPLRPVSALCRAGN